MSGQPRDDREWEHWPHERKFDDGIRHRLRGLFHPTGHGDAGVEEFVAQQGRELELRATQLAETIADLERRENRTSELRVAVEQMLRRGSSELDERHAELAELAARLAEREALAAETERLLAERRTELGAVELRRAALERREASVSEREQALQQHVADLAEREQLLNQVEQRADELVARSTEVAAREERLTQAAEALEERRRQIEETAAAFAEREEALGAEEAALAAQREDLRRAVSTLSATLGVPTPPPTPVELSPHAVSAPPEPPLVEAATHLLLVAGDRYSLVEAAGSAPGVGALVELDQRAYRVVRVGRSPLPADGRRCAFVERAAAGV
jgi:hypothetical protein